MDGKAKISHAPGATAAHVECLRLHEPAMPLDTSLLGTDDDASIAILVEQNQQIDIPLAMNLLSILTPLLFLILPATAQFQFFEHMFGGGGGGPQQPPQNAASDSSWYQAQYENGRQTYNRVTATRALPLTE